MDIYIYNIHIYIYTRKTTLTVASTANHCEALFFTSLQPLDPLNCSAVHASLGGIYGNPRTAIFSVHTKGTHNFVETGLSVQGCSRQDLNIL